VRGERHALLQHRRQLGHVTGGALERTEPELSGMQARFSGFTRSARQP
jgi:hypothetical protein